MHMDVYILVGNAANICDLLSKIRRGIDHCVDQIRESLQCSADLTPIPTRWYPGAGGFVVTDRVHTCRNFDKVQEWATKRFLHKPAAADDMQ